MMPSKVLTCKKDQVLLLYNTTLPSSVSMVSIARCAVAEKPKNKQKIYRRVIERKTKISVQI
jgi:hypothetical protein